MPTPGIAAGTYAQMARITDAGSKLGGAVTGAGDAGGDGSFSGMLKDALASVTEAGHKSDTQAKAVATGKANVLDVVTAVAETEVAIGALVSVRDKVIEAYNDIMKMPI